MITETQLEQNAADIARAMVMHAPKRPPGTPNVAKYSACKRVTITAAQLSEALAEWESFWPAPAHVKSPGKWQSIYLRAVNADKLTARHWEEVRERVYSTCRWFPLPVDLRDAAMQIARERMP